MTYSYTAAISDFDDGSQVEGIAWSPTLGKFEAVALAGGGDIIPLLGNVGQTAAEVSFDGINWGFSAFSTLPIQPCEIADVTWDPTLGRYIAAGYWDPATWGAQPYGEWTSALGSVWSRVTHATTATFECSICVIPAGANIGKVIVGGQLDSGTGRLIGRFTTGSVSTPIDDQQFRVAQIAAHPTTGLLVAALTQVGAVTSTQRIMTSSDGGATWTLRNSALNSFSAYGVCWNAVQGLWVVTGDQDFVTSPDGTTWSTHSGLVGGADTQGKPCEAGGGVTIIPGGSSNTVSEWDGGVGFTSQTLTGALALKVAGYAPALDRVVVGGLGNPANAIWYSGSAPAAALPSLNTRFDLG